MNASILHGWRAEGMGLTHGPQSKGYAGRCSRRRRQVARIKPSAIRPSAMKVVASVTGRLAGLRLTQALTTPPQMKISALPADDAVPARSGKTSIAREVAIGRAMVMPMVQTIMGSSTLKTVKPA